MQTPIRRALALFAAALLGNALPASAQLVEYFHVDAIGSVRAITNQAGIVEQHDFLPFGEEWCGTALCSTPPPGQARRFTGKEREPETGLDYFGARYYGAKIARFTTVDPVLAVSAALIDPQLWNRYAYGRASPLRYVDPTGAILELTGEDREEAFQMIQDTVDSRGASLLYTRNENGRTFVEYRGKEADRLAASGINGVFLANLIDSPRTTEFRVVNGDYVMHTRFQRLKLSSKGGAATVGAEESLNGNIQVFVGRTSDDYMNFYSSSLLGRMMSADPSRPLSFSLPLIAAHELGHAEANLSGIPINSIANDNMALFAENQHRRAHGDRGRRVRH